MNNSSTLSFIGNKELTDSEVKDILIQRKLKFDNIPIKSQIAIFESYRKLGFETQLNSKTLDTKNKLNDNVEDFLKSLPLKLSNLYSTKSNKINKCNLSSIDDRKLPDTRDRSGYRTRTLSDSNLKKSFINSQTFNEHGNDDFCLNESKQVITEKVDSKQISSHENNSIKPIDQVEKKSRNKQSNMFCSSPSDVCLENETPMNSEKFKLSNVDSNSYYKQLNYKELKQLYQSLKNNNIKLKSKIRKHLLKHKRSRTNENLIHETKTKKAKPFNSDVEKLFYGTHSIKSPSISNKIKDESKNNNILKEKKLMDIINKTHDNGICPNITNKIALLNKKTLNNMMQVKNKKLKNKFVNKTPIKTVNLSVKKGTKKKEIKKFKTFFKRKFKKSRQNFYNMTVIHKNDVNKKVTFLSTPVYLGPNEQTLEKDDILVSNFNSKLSIDESSESLNIPQINIKKSTDEDNLSINSNQSSNPDLNNHGNNLFEVDEPEWSLAIKPSSSATYSHYFHRSFNEEDGAISNYSDSEMDFSGPLEETYENFVRHLHTGSKRHSQLANHSSPKIDFNKSLDSFDESIWNGTSNSFDFKLEDSFGLDLAKYNKSIDMAAGLFDDTPEHIADNPYEMFDESYHENVEDQHHEENKYNSYVPPLDRSMTTIQLEKQYLNRTIDFDKPLFDEELERRYIEEERQRGLAPSAEDFLDQTMFF